MKQFALLLLVSASLSFAAETWTLDESHSTARFKVKHMLITNVSGEVGGVTGKFTLEGDWSLWGLISCLHQVTSTLSTMASNVPVQYL